MRAAKAPRSSASSVATSPLCAPPTTRTRLPTAGMTVSSLVRGSVALERPSSVSTATPSLETLRTTHLTLSKAPPCSVLPARAFTMSPGRAHVSSSEETGGGPPKENATLTSLCSVVASGASTRPTASARRMTSDRPSSRRRFLFSSSSTWFQARFCPGILPRNSRASESGNAAHSAAGSSSVTLRTQPLPSLSAHTSPLSLKSATNLPSVPQHVRFMFA
mmetsp:Transcript_17164/g.48964  ORF Transcript_17164/g.48964 Transcript_17164/m.48964 type:complete len:220 (+) Transcript_17164:93-752(+)